VSWDHRFLREVQRNSIWKKTWRLFIPSIRLHYRSVKHPAAAGIPGEQQEGPRRFSPKGLGPLRTFVRTETAAGQPGTGHHPGMST
jgi:hypothetical protein